MATNPLVVITGPTGSGKSGLALMLARQWGGEIVCADSRTIYKGMDIGTAKPTIVERQEVRHWGLDVVNPGQRFTVVDFQRLARQAISDIRSRGKIPLLVGGTGLYVDAVVLDFSFGPEADLAKREQLEVMTIEQLKSLIKRQHLQLPNNVDNKRYLIRCIEKNNISTSGSTMPNADTYVFAIQTEKEVLRMRLRDRIEQMFSDGLVQETQQLLGEYGDQNEAFTGNVYRIVQQLLRGDIDESTAKELCLVRDWQLVRRQTTWLKRHKYVRWVSLADASQCIGSIIQNISDD